MVRLSALPLLWLVCAACAGPVDGASPAEQWVEARDAWRGRSVDAHRMWTALDPESAEGAEARARLARADAEYKRGVRLLRAGDPDARDALAGAVEIAPMDPALYLPLARACRDQGLEPRAAEFYGKYLAAFPAGPEAEGARRELGELAPELAHVFDPEPGTARRPVYLEPAAGPWAALGAGVLTGLALAIIALLLARAVRGRGVSLGHLVEVSPELHPAIAYLAGSLRHELLKHRIGAVGDAVATLSEGRASMAQREFLLTRLYGGQSLTSAWSGHLHAFERALGPRLNMARDREFRRAGHAIRTIEQLAPRLTAGTAGAIERLRQAHARLRLFDRTLAVMVAGMVRTEVNEAFLRAVVDDVRSEYAAGSVVLDEMLVVATDERVKVEVFRVDLVLILKNVIRNAVLAMERAEPPRRLRVDVNVEVEPTGEEVVRIRVCDTSAEPLSTEGIYDRRLDRGLGLVTAALTRYDGSIDVQSADGYAKAVVLRFFRVFDEDVE